MIVLVGGFVVLLALAAVAYRMKRRRDADERLAEIARAGMTRDRYPHVYTGPDTVFGLKSGTPCRVRSHKQGNVVCVVTPDARGWNVAGQHVVKRQGKDAPAARAPRPGRRARRRAAA